MSGVGERVRENYGKVLDTIGKACKRRGRDPSEVKVVAVTKSVTAEVVDLLAEVGIVEIGENRVQDALKKREDVRGNFTWHMIGHLQSNKAARAAGLFSWIHSVESVELAKKLQECALREGKGLSVFVQVNVGGEEQKQGVRSEAEASALVGRVRAECPNLSLRGLMTMAPLSSDPERSRPVFRSLREMGERLGLMEYSMGMSQDYAVAVEEGATTLRIGTALFEGIRDDG
ncbi:MAG: YggS family pyridoxal phosphate enzyme [Planctomycetes bacterium RBG_16_59_8]|nr:MAG: YggS family pyridoxal phosphate enzyme [Planctomycetes bacterium RBG_16_59_8]